MYLVIATAAIRDILARPGTIGHRWDWSIPPSADYLKSMTSNVISTWDPRLLGYRESFGITSQIFSATLGLPGHFGLSGDFVSKSLVLFTMLLAGLGMYRLIIDILRSTAVIDTAVGKKTLLAGSFLGGYFYMLSPLLFNMLIHGVASHFVAYALAPWIFLSFHIALLKDSRNYLILTIITMSLIAASLKITILVMAIMAFYGVFFRRKKAALFFLYLFLGWFLVNAYWLLPSLMGAGEVIPVILEQENVKTLLTQSRVHSSTLPEAFSVAGYVKFTDKSFFLATLPDWFYPIWFYVTIGLVLAVFSSLLLQPRNREVLFWSGIVAVSIIFVTGTHPPFGGLVEILYTYLPIFVIFVSVWVFIFPPTFAYAILLGFAMIILAKRLRRLTVPFLILLILVSVWTAPFFTGNLGGKVDVFNLPPEYERINAMISRNNDHHDFRILYLPMAASPRYRETEYQSTMQGGDPIIFWSPWPQIVADIVPNHYARSYAADFESKMYRETLPPDIVDYLRKSNIKYIVLRKDVEPNFGTLRDMWNYERMFQNLMHMPGVELLANYTYASLWENKLFLPKVYAVDIGNSLRSVAGDVSSFLPAPTGYRFDQEHDHIEVASSDSIQIPRIISLWAYFEDLTDVALVSKGSWFQQKGWMLWVDDSKMIRFDFQSRGKWRNNLLYRLNEGLHMNSWHHYVVTYDNSYINLYIDGELVATLNQTNPIEPSDMNLWLGKRADAPQVAFRGFMRDVRIYNKLNSTQTVLPFSTGYEELKQFYSHITPLNITFFKDSSTQFRVNVNASSPFLLVLSESFDSGWNAYINGKQIGNHSLYNNFANAWLIDQIGNFTIEIVYSPQRAVLPASLISVSALLGLALFPLLSWKKKPLKVPWKNPKENDIYVTTARNSLKASVVIPTYNRCEDLKRCLDSLEKQTYKDFEVIVIDNCSSDNTPSLLRNYHVKVIRDCTKNVSRLFNLGIQNATGEVITFINDDVEVSEEWMAALIEVFKTIPEAGCVGGPTIPTRKQEIQSTFEELSRSRRLHLLAKLYNNVILEGKLFEVGFLSECGAYSIGASMPYSSKLQGLVTVDIISTINMAVRRSALEEVNGFDENFIWVHPDVDLVLRVKKRGYKVMFTPKAVVLHHVNPHGDTRVPSYIARDFAIYFAKDGRPRSLSGLIRLILYVMLFNGYWLYKFYKTKNKKFLYGIISFINGIREYFKIRNRMLR